MRIRYLYGLSSYLKNRGKIKTYNNVNIILMSVNVRCISKNDKKEKNWLYRAKYLKKNIENNNPDIIGFQEATIVQLRFLKKILKDYSYVYRKRDKRSNSETCAIFYKKDKFELIDKNNFFLSETPNIMSKSWGSKCIRICTYAILKEISSSKELIVLNTHLDHISELARIKGIELINSKINEFGFSFKPHILLGDMNDVYGSKTIDTLFSNMIDSSNHDQKNTFNGYDIEESKKIDYIAVSKDIKVIEYKVIDDIYKVNDKVIYPSDHYQLKVEFKI